MAAKEGPESVNMVEADSIHWDPGMELTLKGPVQRYGLLKFFLFGSVDVVYSFKLFNSIRAYIIYCCFYFTSDSVLQVVVSGGALSLVMWFNSRAQLVHEIERRLTTVAVLRTEQLQDYLNGEMDKMQLIATRVQLVSYLSMQSNVNESTAVKDLSSAVTAVSEFLSAAIYNASGHLMLSAGDSESLFNDTLSAEQLHLVQSDVHFDMPIPTQDGWKYLVSRNITLVGSPNSLSVPLFS